MLSPTTWDSQADTLASASRFLVEFHQLELV